MALASAMAFPGGSDSPPQFRMMSLVIIMKRNADLPFIRLSLQDIALKHRNRRFSWSIK